MTEGAAHLIEAELAAVVVADKVVSTLGFPRSQVPHDEILRAAGTLRGRVMVPGIGVCMTVVGRSSRHSPVGLVVARLPEESFSTEETNLVRGMGRVLDLTMGMIGVLQAERELRERSERQAEENAELPRSLQARQHLLEELSRIQRAISRHEPLASIFETIVTAARDLTGANAAALRLADDGRPEPRGSGLVHRSRRVGPRRETPAVRLRRCQPGDDLRPGCPHGEFGGFAPGRATHKRVDQVDSCPGA